MPSPLGCIRHFCRDFPQMLKYSWLFDSMGVLFPQAALGSGLMTPLAPGYLSKLVPSHYYQERSYEDGNRYHTFLHPDHFCHRLTPIRQEYVTPLVSCQKQVSPFFSPFQLFGKESADGDICIMHHASCTTISQDLTRELKYFFPQGQNP